jgi:hypothetical protein
MSRRTLKVAVVTAAVALSAAIGLATATNGSAAVRVPAVDAPHPAPEASVAGRAAVDGSQVIAPGTAPAEPTSSIAPNPNSSIELGTCAACVFPPE